MHTTRRVPMLEESDATPLAVQQRAHSVYHWEANVSIVASKHLIVTRTILRRGEKNGRMHACHEDVALEDKSTQVKQSKIK